MRVGYDALTLQPPFSGVLETVAQAAVALGEALGEELVVFLPSAWGGLSSPPAQGSGRQGGLESPPHAEVVRAPLSGRNRLARILWEQACLPAAARRRGCEVLHGPAYVLPLRWRGPSVLTVHDLLTLTHPEWCKRGNVWHFRAILPRAARQATRIAVPSASVGEEVAALPGVDGSRVRVLPWGISARYRPAPPEEQERVRARYGLTGPYLLAVGVIEPKKNHAGLLQIFRRMLSEIPHQLVIAGREGWGDLRAFRRAWEELPPARVKLLGYVPAEDLPALYSGTDLCLQLSWYEGFGIPPLEAMVCGAATVVSNRGALPEISGPGALVVDPADQPETARALLSLLGDTAARRALAERGRAHARQFTWARHVEGLLEVYREAVGA